MSASLVEIDVYTLEHVLKYSRLSELCDIAYTHPHLRNAARFEFLRRHKRKEFVLRLINIQPEYCDEGEEKVIVYSLGLVLRFLRSFGDLINNVTISCVNDGSPSAMHVVTYLCLFCSDSVKKITFSHLYIDVMRLLNRAFMRVEEISFVSSLLDPSLMHFSLFLPNVRKINFLGWNTVVPASHDLTRDCELIRFLVETGVDIDLEE